MDLPGLNPYFIGLSILIAGTVVIIDGIITVSILILLDYLFLFVDSWVVNHTIGEVSILILLDYLFLSFVLKYRR